MVPHEHTSWIIGGYLKEGKENALTFTKKCPAFTLFIFRGFGDFSVSAQRLPRITYTVRDKWWIFDPLGICQENGT